jgi:hypothetical protein
MAMSLWLTKARIINMHYLAMELCDQRNMFFYLAKIFHFLTKKLGLFWKKKISSVNTNNFANFLVKFHQNTNMRKREKNHS